MFPKETRGEDPGRLEGRPPRKPVWLLERLNQECLDFKAILDYTSIDRYVNKQMNQGKRASHSFSALRAGKQDLLEWLALCSLG